MKMELTNLFVVATLALSTCMPSVDAAIEVTPDHVVTGTVTGTLVALDVPFNNSTGSTPVFGGPDWPEDADDGFVTLSSEDGGSHDGLRGPMGGTSRWEPDGTPLAEAVGYFTFGNGPAPSVMWTFDIPDNSIINAIYATWQTRNVDGITYQYSEGAVSDSTIRQTGGAAPLEDLVLRWTDSDSNTHDGNIERIFMGPITVEGGDGFTLWGTDNIGNAAHIDAVVLDVTLAGFDPDINEDYLVNAADLNLLLSDYVPGDDTGVGAPYSSADLEDLLAAFGQDNTPSEGTNRVPEPASMVLLLFGALGLLSLRRRS